MRVLFFQWNAFMQKGIENAMQQMDIQYDVFYYDMTNKNWDEDADLKVQLNNYIKNAVHKYDCIFSVNFSPVISEVCMQADIKYICWVYDCPINIRKIETLKNKCNDIYFFDYNQAQSYRAMGVEGAKYMTLAVDSSVFLNNPDMLDSSYKCDVSLVGQLYRSDYEYISRYQDDYTRGYLEGIISAQEKIYGGYIIEDCVNDSLMKCINDNFYKVSKGTYSVIKPEVTYALATEVTGRERFKALALLQNRCDVNLYSKDFDKRLANVKQKGYVDYYTQMPKVFCNSKINLNISLKAIQTGIPLRVLDVLGCGGFLITNYQQEIAQYFEIGKELVVYEDIPDLVAKTMYYLEHEDERLWIAKNGHNKVLNDFAFDSRLKEMFKNV